MPWHTHQSRIIAMFGMLCLRPSYWWRHQFGISFQCLWRYKTLLSLNITTASYSTSSNSRIKRPQNGKEKSTGLLLLELIGMTIIEHFHDFILGTVGELILTCFFIYSHLLFYRRWSRFSCMLRSWDVDKNHNEGRKEIENRFSFQLTRCSHLAFTRRSFDKSGSSAPYHPSPHEK